MLKAWRPLGPAALALAALALLPAPAAADLDPGLKNPYHLRVVLHFAEHRFLTPTFRGQVRRQLGDLLRLHFGPLAKVNVTDSDPLLKDVLAKGLGPALDGCEELSDVKKHFVLIDYAGGRYRVRARQHDGLTGLNSPVVREEHAGDPRGVARLAARLVDRDFGLVGTVTSRDENGVALTLRGGGLGVPLDRWIRPDDVLAVAHLREEAGKARAARVEWALLRVVGAPADGVCRGRYVHRYRADALQDGPGTLGYRGLRLGTTTAPLRLRLLDEKTFAPLDGLAVHVSHGGFGEPGVELTTGADGLVVTPDAYAGVAFVQVLVGKDVKVQIPVEIVDDRTVVCRVSISKEDFVKSRLDLRREGWLRRIYEELRLANDRVARLNALLEKAPEEALQAARQGQKGLTRALTSLRAEEDELRRAADGLDLGEGDQRLRELGEQRDRLGKFITNLEGVIREATSQKAKDLKMMVQRASLLESQADYPQAIALYRKILDVSPKESNVRARLEKLEREWEPKGPDHEQARKYIYDAWPKKMDTAALKAALPEAWKALRVCQKAGDKLAPRKMLGADLAHASQLKDRLAALRKAPEREDTRTETRTILELAAELQRLHAEVSAYVRKAGA
jgi:hypothetical protein